MKKKFALGILTALAICCSVLADDDLKWIDINSQIAEPTVYAAAPQPLVSADGFSSWWRTSLVSNVIAFSSKIASGVLLLVR